MADIPALRTKLVAAKVEFTEETIYPSPFWGHRFIFKTRKIALAAATALQARADIAVRRHWKLWCIEYY